jgi:hypothetical protein
MCRTTSRGPSVSIFSSHVGWQNHGGMTCCHDFRYSRRPAWDEWEFVLVDTVVLIKTLPYHTGTLTPASLTQTLLP